MSPRVRRASTAMLSGIVMMGTSRGCGGLRPAGPCYDESVGRSTSQVLRKYDVMVVAEVTHGEFDPSDVASGGVIFDRLIEEDGDVNPASDGPSNTSSTGASSRSSPGSAIASSSSSVVGADPSFLAAG